MTDDLVKRLRVIPIRMRFGGAYADDCCIAADEITRLRAEIERLTRERDEAHQRYVDANEARIDAEKSLTDAYMAGAADARKERDSARVTMSEALRQADAEIARAEAAERKVEKLREALEPFAEWCAEMEGVCSRLADDAGVAGSITMGNTRRARAALKETEDT